MRIVTLLAVTVLLVVGCADRDEPPPVAVAEPSPTWTATATATSTPTPTATATAAPTPTVTVSPTATATPVPSPTPTIPPTATPTMAPTATPTPTPTAVPTATATPTLTPTTRPTFTPTPTAIPTSTTVPTATPTRRPTVTPTPTATPWPRASSDPPTWVFTDDVREQDRLVYQEEMERVRGFYSDRFGYEVSDFTVLVGREGPLRDIYEQVTCVKPRSTFSASGWVFTGCDGRTFFVVKHRKPITSYNILAHEYIHVLQYHLAGWGGDDENGMVRVTRFAPSWHVEGFAVYGNYLYAETRPEWAPFIPTHFFPYRYLECHRDVWPDPGAELQRQEESCNFYDLAFLGMIFMMEELPALAGISIDASAWLDYWKLLADVESKWVTTQVAERTYYTTFEVDWQPAFEEAFGISAADFYAAFGDWASTDVIEERASLGQCPYCEGEGCPTKP